MNKETFKTIVSIIALMSLLIFSYLYTKKSREFNPFTLEIMTPMGPTHLANLTKNKITLLYFGFLSCPDACPTTLATVSSAFKELEAKDLDKLNFLFVDLDPERDTLDKLKSYTSFFHPKITPVSIPLQDLDAFTRFFGIAFMKVPLKSSKMGYTIDHSTDILVMNSKGKIISHIEHGTTRIHMIALIKKIIVENK